MPQNYVYPKAETTLNAEKVARTTDLLSERVKERFPDSGIWRISRELYALCRKAEQEAPTIGRPNYWVRIAVAILILAIVVLVIALLVAGADRMHDVVKADIIDWVTAIESGTNEIFLISLAILFLITLETRIKRNRALRAIHELRALAHVIDMHQLTKDPAYYRVGALSTRSSPRRTMTLQQLVRYLDYCSELLSLTGKVSALYVQTFNDGVTLAAASDVENLTSAMSAKIWQKLNIASSIPEIVIGGDETAPED